MNPGNYHGVSAFDPDGMPDPEVAPKESFSTTFGQALAREAAQNSRICAITAAMKYGTGLQFFPTVRRSGSLTWAWQSSTP